MTSQASTTVSRESIGSVQVVLDITGGMEELLQSVGSDGDDQTELDGETVTFHQAQRATTATASLVPVSSIASSSFPLRSQVNVTDFAAAAAISEDRDAILEDLERRGEGSQGDRRARRARAQILSLDQSALSAISNLGNFTFGNTPSRSALDSLEGASVSTATATGATTTASATGGRRIQHRRIRSSVLTRPQAVIIWTGEPTQGDDSQETDTA